MEVLWVSYQDERSGSAKSVGVQLTKDGRLSFTRLAKLLRISISDSDDVELWTLGDVNLIVDRESKELLTEGPVKGLFEAPLGTKANPLVLLTGKENAEPPAPAKTPTRTPTKGASAACPAASPPPPGSRGAPASARRRTPLGAANHMVSSPTVTKSITRAGARAAAGSTPEGGSASIPAPIILSGSAGLIGAPGPEVVCDVSRNLFSDGKAPGQRFFLMGREHLPMLLAAHLDERLQALMRRFAPSAQELLVAHAMALYSAANSFNYFESKTMAQAITKARREGANTNRVVTQSVRLTGLKRRAPEAATPAKQAASSLHVPMDVDPVSRPGQCTPPPAEVATWKFACGGSVQCPGAVCAKTQRPESLHDNWLYCDGASQWQAFLPVMHEEAGTVVLLPVVEASTTSQRWVWPSPLRPLPLAFTQQADSAAAAAPAAAAASSSSITGAASMQAQAVLGPKDLAPGANASGPGTTITWFKYYVPGSAASGASTSTAAVAAGACVTPNGKGGSAASAPAAAVGRSGFWSMGLAAHLPEAVAALYGAPAAQSLLHGTKTACRA